MFVKTTTICGQIPEKQLPATADKPSVTWTFVLSSYWHVLLFRHDIWSNPGLRKIFVSCLNLSENVKIFTHIRSTYTYTIYMVIIVHLSTFVISHISRRSACLFHSKQKIYQGWNCFGVEVSNYRDFLQSPQMPNHFGEEAILIL